MRTFFMIAKKINIEIIIKLAVDMYFWIVTILTYICIHDVIDDVYDVSVVRHQNF